MSKTSKKLNFWMRRRSHIATIAIGSVVILLLFFNEDTSVRLNMEYQQEITRLNAAIKSCNDSAIYYRTKREALLTNPEELEQLAREEYHMQRPSEDVYILKH